MPLPTVTPETPTPDGELLRRFVADRDEAAFELLVWRHSRLVFDVCRRVLRHRHDAEDAAQATFLVFARKADTVRTAVAGWLAQVAYRCALKVANGRCQPAGASDLAKHQPVDTGRSPDLPDLDAELNRLPDHYRLPLVLCCLRGLSYQEAAAQLNVKPGTLSGRLSRAKALLRERLLARGVVVPAVAVFLADLPRGSALAPEAIRTIMTAAFAPAAQGDRVAAVAHGVTRMLTLHTFARRSFAVIAVAAGVLLAGGYAARLPADESKKPAPADPPKANTKADQERVQGEWVFDSAEAIGGNNAINQAWHSVVTFDGEKLNVTKYQGFDWKTTFNLDPTASPKTFDMTVNELAKKVMGFKDGAMKGIYRFDGDDLEICLAGTPADPRPKEFATGPKLKQFRFTLKKKAKDFDPAKLTEFKVTVVDGDGKPVEGAVVAHQAYFSSANEGGTYALGDKQNVRTDKAGEVIYGLRDFAPWQVNGMLYARQEKRKLGAMEPISPARIMGGVTLTLRPEAKLSGKVVFPESKDPGRTDVYLCSKTTMYVCSYGDPAGAFDFRVPAGEYRLLVRGDHVKEEMTPGERSYPALSNTTAVAVGIEGKVLKLEVEPNKVGALRGKVAPDLGEMAEWKGQEVKPADLKGKVVLLYFWDTNLPTAADDLARLMELHDDFADKGLLIVGVHVPGASKPITSVKVLDERLATARKDVWKGRDLPFSVGLVAKQDGPAVKAFGIDSFPTNVLIDKSGKVVGHFSPYREADLGRLQKLLEAK